MPTIDADAHVVESERTWDYLEASDRKYRPRIVRPDGEGGPEYWLIDGKIRGLVRVVLTARELADVAARTGRVMETPRETREMENVPARLRHMDELGIDVQVLYPTIFIEQVTDKPECDIALCRAYNRWLADIYREGQGRLTWICVLPLLDMRAALEELAFCKANGACGVFMRAIEGHRLMTDPYFYPLYDEMSRLDLAVGVHVGNGNPQNVDLVSQYNGGGSFWKFRVPVIGGFHSVIMSGLPERFPQLRFHWAEAAAQWIPYVVKDLRRRWAAAGKELPENPLKEYRQYVSCQTDDDVGYILRYAGEDNLVIGTDYGHNDQSTEIEALRNLRQSGEITQAQYDKIAFDNPKALFALAV
ncbi:MAG TPA: amidohydrolase family protein [candidate division Zixibacteria bacterium]|nr:amidohydrolase family protein [candidate division Zixibacteria bacterium]